MRKLLILGLFLAINCANAESVIDKALGYFKPAKEFAGVSLNSSKKEIKQLGFQCEDGTDAKNGKVINFITCEDNNYRGNVFGLDVKSRSVFFVDGKLAVVKVMQRDMFVSEDSYEVLRKKLDTVFQKVRAPINADQKGGYWDYGGGFTLASGPPIKIQTDFSDFSKFMWSQGIVVTTPAADAIR
jgi:hypothetical protein